MRVSGYIKIMSLIICLACLALGYMQRGYWFMIPVTVGLLITWILTEKKVCSWIHSTLFCVCVIFAVVGLTMNLSDTLMFFACMTALVSWELTLFARAHSGDQASFQNEKMEKLHLSMLAIMSVTSLVLFIVNRYIKLQIPFGLIVVLALITICSLAIGMKTMIKQ